MGISPDVFRQDLGFAARNVSEHIAEEAAKALGKQNFVGSAMLEVENQVLHQRLTCHFQKKDVVLHASAGGIFERAARSTCEGRLYAEQVDELIPLTRSILCVFSTFYVAVIFFDERLAQLGSFRGCAMENAGVGGGKARWVSYNMS